MSGSTPPAHFLESTIHDPKGVESELPIPPPMQKAKNLQIPAKFQWLLYTVWAFKHCTAAVSVATTENQNDIWGGEKLWNSFCGKVRRPPLAHNGAKAWPRLTPAAGPLQRYNSGQRCAGAYGLSHPCSPRPPLSMPLQSLALHLEDNSIFLRQKGMVGARAVRMCKR